MTNEQINQLTLPIFENLLISNINYLKENGLIKDKAVLKMLNSQIVNGKLINNAILKGVYDRELFYDKIEEMNDALALITYSYIALSPDNRVKLSVLIDNFCNEIN